MTFISTPFASSDLLVAERDILARVAVGGNLSTVLRDIILLIEKPSHGEMLASILLTSEDGQNLIEGAAPSLPPEYNAAVDGIPVAIGVGSCGTAAFTGQPVMVTDIATDPNWADYRDIALKHGLQACWSMPIVAADGRILGTFANYYREPKKPTERDLEVIAMVTRTTAIAIERFRNEQARERAEEQRQLLTRELNHRVKNIFALVDSLLFMSARSATNVRDFSEAVRGRLNALNHAHELVQPGLAIGEPAAEQDVPLLQLLTDIVAPYVHSDPDKVSLTGEAELAISPKAITGMALILHELATNAAKYGALSRADGKLTVHWQKSTRLKLVWREHAEAKLVAPTHTGFGSKLTKRTVEGQFRGTIEYHWHETGLEVVMDFPLSAVCGRIAD
jgi:two-component sensor histidine kinase